MAPGKLDERSFLIRAFALPGVAYPCGYWLAPSASLDPPAGWLAIGAAFLAVPLVHAWRPLPRARLQDLMILGSSLITLHLFLLASANQMQTFYALGSSIAALATAFCIRSTRQMLVYSLFVTLLGASLFVTQPDELKLYYWGGVLPVLLLAYQRLRSRLSHQHEVEERTKVETERLQQTNRRLLSEMDERALAEDELRTVEKMEAVERLAAGVAHDFNNLLTIIGIYAELVLAGLPDDSPLRDEMTQIQKANEQAGSLAQQLLTLGRRSLAEVEQIDLNEVIREAEPTLQAMLKAETQLTLELTGEPQPIWASRDQLRTILVGLARNAQDAISGPGSLRIETRRCAASDLAEHFVSATPTSDVYVQLNVSDSGDGMRANVRRRAFDPFFTTREPNQHPGLGLSIVHGIVRQAQGHVRLQSQPGEGTRLELYWPLAVSKSASDATG